MYSGDEFYDDDVTSGIVDPIRAESAGGLDVALDRAASVPEFELWPTDPDWQPHDASVVYISRRSLTMHPPGKSVYHLTSRRTSRSIRTGCGIELWSGGWEPGRESPLVAVRRDVASRIAHPCRVCGADA